MEKSRFRDKQIIGVQKLHEAGGACGGSVPGAWRRRGDVLQAEIEVLRAIEVSEAQRIRWVKANDMAAGQSGSGSAGGVCN